MDNHVPVVTDSHIAVNRYFGLDVMFNAFADAIDYASETSIRMVFHNGDFFDRTKIGVEELVCARKIIKYAREKTVTLIINSGNHCLNSAGLSLPIYLQEQDLLPPVQVVVDTPQSFLVRGDYMTHKQEVHVVVMPYGSDVKTAIELGATRGYKKGILLAHTDVCGAHYDSGHISNGGWSKGELASVENAFDLVLLGHIHLPQQLGRKTHYIGAMLQYNFGAVGQPRGYVIVDAGNLTVKTKRLVGNPWPEFVDLDYSKFQSDFEFQPMTNVRAFVGEDNQESDEEIISKVMAAGASSCKVEREIAVKLVNRRSDIKADDSPRTMGEKFIRTVYNEETDKEEIRECLKIHEKVLSLAGL